MKKMIFKVVNWDVHVGTMDIGIISDSSIVLVGDTQTIQLSSVLDTPADSLIIGPFVPVSPEG